MKGYCAALILACTQAVSAQTVYKCKGPDGSPIFTQERCGNDAEEHQVRVIAPSAEDMESASEDYQARAAQSRVASKESQCVRQAQRSASGSSGARVRQLQGRINQLENRIALRANNLAGATWEAGMREEIASLHQAIATERASAESTYSSAVERCARAREREEAALLEGG